MTPASNGHPWARQQLGENQTWVRWSDARSQKVAPGHLSSCHRPYFRWTVRKCPDRLQLGRGRNYWNIIDWWVSLSRNLRTTCATVPRATLLASKTSSEVEMGDLAPASSHHIVIIQSNFDNIVKCWKGAEQHFLITALAFYFIFRNQSKTLECMEHWGERRDGDCSIQFPCWIDPNMCNCADLNICALCNTQCAQPTPPAHQDHIVYQFYLHHHCNTQVQWNLSPLVHLEGLKNNHGCNTTIKKILKLLQILKIMQLFQICKI